MLHLSRRLHHVLMILIFCSRALSAQNQHAERVLSGHLDAITMGAFTPDGQSVVTVGFDHTARLWDVASQSERRQYTQHTAPIFCMAVSGDGTTLVTGAQDNTVRVWDLPSSQPLRRFSQHKKRVNAITLSPRGDALVSASADHTVQIHSLSETDAAVARMGHLADVLAVDYRSDGGNFASSDTSGRILLWSPYLDDPQFEWISHDGVVGALRFASNNQQLFSGGDDGVVRMWQLPPAKPKRVELGDTHVLDWSILSNRTQAFCLGAGGTAFVLNLGDGRIAREFPKLDFNAAAVAAAPNDSWACIADEAGKVHLWNLNDGSVRATIDHTVAVTDVAIHADSIRWATACADGLVRVWGQPTDDHPQQPLHTLQVGQAESVAATAVAFATDQKHVLCGTADGKIHQWSLADGELVRTLDCVSGQIEEIVVTPNSQLILSLGVDRTLRSWQSSDGAAMHVMKSPADVLSVAVSPDSGRAAVGCDDGLIRVWDLQTGALLQSVTGHRAGVSCIGFLSDGQSIISTAADKTFNVSRTSIIRAMPIHNSAIRDMSLYSGGSQVLTCDSESIVMTNAYNGAPVRQYRAADDEQVADGETTYKAIDPVAVAVRFDNQRIAGATATGDVYVWNTNNGDKPLTMLNVGAPVTALAYSPDNQKLAVATAAPAVHIFGPSIPAAQPQLELTKHQDLLTGAGVTDLQFSADNQTLFVALDDGEVATWNYAGIAQRRQMNHSGGVYGVAISHDGTLAVSCSTDQTVRVWNTATGQQKSQLRGHNGAVHAVTISKDETFAVTSGADGTLRLWDIVGGRQLKQLTTYDDTMYSIAVHPEGTLVAAAGADRKVHLLDMISGEERQTLEGHTDYIHCVAFDATGDRLLSYGYAGHLKVWNTADGSLLHQSRIGKVGNYAQFSPDGETLLLCGGDGTARVVPLSKLSIDQ